MGTNKRTLKFRSGTLRQVGMENYRRQQRKLLLVELLLMLVLSPIGVYLVYRFTT